MIYKNVNIFFIITVCLRGKTCDGNVLDAHEPWRDNNLYDIDWLEHGSFEKLDAHDGPHELRTSYNESYGCFVPLNVRGENQDEALEKDAEISIPVIFDALMTNKICLIRIEGYWIYELCHGKYLRQFHQEIVKPHQAVITKEYLLGKFLKEHEKVTENLPAKLPILEWKGLQMPYFEIPMTEGTPCDIINNAPRSTVIRYVCTESEDPDSILQINEIASCEYQLIVSVRTLCFSPLFLPKKSAVHKIKCISDSSQYVDPFNVVKMQMEIAATRRSFSAKPQISISTYPTNGQAENVEDDSDNGFSDTSDPLPQTPWDQATPPAALRHSTYTPDEKQVLAELLNFLDGKFCVHGGTGYWKHSFCFGKTVIQYHEEGSVLKNENIITLGAWDPEVHLEWLEKNPRKRFDPAVKPVTIVHYYHDGDVCDLNGKPRTIQVKIKCTESSHQSSSAVSLYLLEPQTCQYVLGVESAMFCHIMPYVDENNLIAMDVFREDVHEELGSGYN